MLGTSTKASNVLGTGTDVDLAAPTAKITQTSSLRNENATALLTPSSTTLEQASGQGSGAAATPSNSAGCLEIISLSGLFITVLVCLL